MRMSFLYIVKCFTDITSVRRSAQFAPIVVRTQPPIALVGTALHALTTRHNKTLYKLIYLCTRLFDYQEDIGVGQSMALVPFTFHSSCARYFVR